MKQDPEKRGWATMKDVAELAKVSVGTVSRVVNGNDTVRLPIRERVVAAMRQLGYEPNPLAQSMRTKSTHAISCMVSNISNPLFSVAVGAAEEVLYRAGYTLVLTNSHDRVEREREVLSLVRRRRLDGMLTTVSKEEDAGILEAFRSLGVPVVLLERVLSLPFDSVRSDHADGIAQACRYLFTIGRERIGLITVPISAWPGHERRNGYCAAHEAVGRAVAPELMAFEGFTPEYGYEAAQRQLSAAEPPTAIIAGANQLVGVLKAIRGRGLRIPEDVSIISLGDSDLASIFTPPITTVRWDMERIGRTAAELLLARITGERKGEPVHMLFPVELILRDSCAPLA